MLDKRPEPVPQPQPQAVVAGETDAEQQHFDPTGAPEPLTGRGPAPRVKRFNRKTVAILVLIGLLVMILAFGTSLTRQRASRAITETSGQKMAANGATSDSINGLPNDYGQIKRPPQLGTPLPGDIGAIARASETGPRASPAQPRSLSPLEQYEQQQAMERIKREDQARQAGFSFEGGGRGATPTGVIGAGGDMMDKFLAQQQPGKGGLMPVADRASTSRDDDNRQDDKSAFVNGERTNRWHLKNGQMSAPSPYTLFSSTIIPGVLITGINSDLPGQIKGQVSQNVFDTVSGQHLLVPQGSVLVGQYDSRVTYGQSRVLIVWTRIIRPDGSNIDLEGMPGTDLSGYAGLTGDVDRHILRLLTAVVLGSVIQAGVQSGTSVGYGSQSFGDAAKQGVGSGVSDATQQLTRKELQLQPTIKVAPGERFDVFLTRDVILSPYKL